MDEQELFERSVALGLRAAKVVVERGEGLAGIDRLIWQCEHPPRLAIAMEARQGPDRATGLDGEAATARASQEASPDTPGEPND